MLSKPSVARARYTHNSTDETPTIKQCATDACEVVAIIVTAGGSAATYRIVDSVNAAAGYSAEDGIAVSARSSSSSTFTPAQPIPFRKGCAIVQEQGENFNAECTVILN